MPRLISPVPEFKVRLADPHGKGFYGASRKTGRHHGIDLEAKAGDPVVSPVSGEIVAAGFKVYKDAKEGDEKSRLTGIRIRASDGSLIDLYYVGHHADIKPGKRINAGDSLGSVQDLARVYPGITNHVHIRIKKDDRFVDPILLFQEFRDRDYDP